MITHHPAPESLMSCAAGSMPEAFAAVMVRHIAMCTTCRKELAVMEQIGGALFTQIESQELEIVNPSTVLRNLKESRCDDQCDFAGRGLQSLEIPADASFDHVPWKVVAPGVSEHHIELSRVGRGSLRLMKAAPGTALPTYVQCGTQLTLVLRGSVQDHRDRFGVGDVADVGDERVPFADLEHGCVCLVAIDASPD